MNADHIFYFELTQHIIYPPAIKAEAKLFAREWQTTPNNRQ